MAMTSQPLPNLDLLLAQTDWVRALARRLVSDVDAADDVAQSTWLALLRRPLARSESVEALRAWLATTLRRNAARDSVERARRSERERMAARAERLPSTLDVLEQESVRRALVEAVLALDEPYRSALIMRYFEGLAPGEIATRLNVSGSTARTRLQRGLALLRDRFERERGASWKSWCLLVVPAAKAASLGGGMAGGAIMSSKLKLAALVALALCGSFVAWKAIEMTAGSQAASSRDQAVAKLETPLDAAATEPERASKSSTNDSVASTMAAASSQRQSVESPEAAATDPVGILVYGAIVDENGAVPNARKDSDPGAISMSVRFTEDHGDDVWSPANSKGLYSQAGLHAGHWRVTTWAQGFQNVPTDVVLTASEPIRRLDLRMRHAVLVRIKIVTPEGEPLKQALKADHSFNDPFAAIAVIAVATGTPPGPRLPETLERNHSHFGSSTYWGWGSSVSPAPVMIPESDSGIIELKEGLPAYVSLAMRDIVLDTQLAALGTEELTFTLPLEKVRTCIGHARVRIVDGVTGEPLPASAAMNEMDTVNSDTAADKDGVVEFANVMPGYLLLHINCPDHESIIERVHIDPGVLTDLGTYRLLPGVCIEGRVVDEKGKPVQGSIAAIEFDERWDTRDWFRYSMQPNGEFRLPRMRHARFWMWADGGSNEAPLVSPPVLVDARAGDVRGLEFQLSRPVRVFVRLKSAAPWNSRVRLVSSDGAQQAAAGLRDEGTMSDVTWLNALPGEYELQLVSQDRVVRSRHVTVGASKLEVDL
jgi:RNA polymerase sigma-70 factor (ECF subfamily)